LPIQKYFGILDACIPASNANTSVYFVYNQSLNAVIETAYPVHDCTGPYFKATIPFGSGAIYYSNTPFSTTNLVGYHVYENTDCSGTPYDGTGWSPAIYNKCHFGTRVTCNGNELIVNKFADNDCTGAVTNAENLVSGQCHNGKKAFCSGSFDIPGNYMANIQYNGFECGETIAMMQFSLLDLCTTSDTGSKMLVYDVGNYEIISYEYPNSTTCAKGTPNTRTNIKLDSYTFGLSASLEAVTVTKWLMISIVLNLSIYLL